MLQTNPQTDKQTNSMILVFKVIFDLPSIPDISDCQFWKQFGQQFREELTKKRCKNRQYITDKNKINKMVLSIEEKEDVLVYVTLQAKCRSRIQILESCHHWKAELCKGPNKSRVPPNETFMSFPLILFDQNAADNHCGFNSFGGYQNIDIKSGFKRPFPISNNENINIDKFLIPNSREPVNKTFTIDDLYWWSLEARNPRIDPIDSFSESLKGVLSKNFKPDLRYFREDYNEFLFGFDPDLAKSAKNAEKDHIYRIIDNRLADEKRVKSANIRLWKLAKIIFDCRYGNDLKLKESIQKFEYEYFQVLDYKERIILNDMKLYSLCQEIVSSIKMGQGQIVYGQIRQIKNEFDYLFGEYIKVDRSDSKFLIELQKEYDNDIFILEQCYFMLASFYQEQKANEFLVESAQKAIKLFRGDTHPVYYSNFGRDLVLLELIKNIPQMRKRATLKQNLMLKLLFESIKCMVPNVSSIARAKAVKK